jgi:hypothetical protein
MEGHLTDVPSSNQHTVKPWFSGQLDFSAAVKNLDANGFSLEGGHWIGSGDRAVAWWFRGSRLEDTLGSQGPSRREYLDAGPAGQRPGSVRGYDPPKYMFHHTMLLKRGPLTANIDVHIRYTLEPVERATRVIRALDLTIQMHGLLKVAEHLVVFALAELKRYVEAQPKQSDLNIGRPEAP